jgi:hypothetical protein
VIVLLLLEGAVNVMSTEIPFALRATVGATGVAGTSLVVIE